MPRHPYRPLSATAWIAMEREIDLRRQELYRAAFALANGERSTEHFERLEMAAQAFVSALETIAKHKIAQERAQRAKGQP